MIIAIEGIDGSGKTTIANFLKKELERLGYKVELLKEPGDSVWGKKLKNSLRKRLPPDEELKLFILDRKYNVEKFILPALKSGRVVILDRYYYSTLAYQGALGFDINSIKKQNESFAPKPDLVIILDVDPSKATTRIKKKRELNEFERIDYLNKVRKLFLSIKDDNIVVVNANKDLESVKDEVKRIVLKKLKNG